MRIAVDGLNIRKGGGETVMVRLASAMQARGHDVRLLSGTRDLIDRVPPRLADTISVEHVPIAASALGALRFRHGGWRRAVTPWADAVLGFNYHVPGPTFQATYHINVIPFLPFAERRAANGLTRAVINRLYARRALTKSDLNLFESRHLLSLAQQSVATAIRNPLVRYIGVDRPDAPPQPTAFDPRRIAVVTSPARHKRNELLLPLLAILNQSAGHEPYRLRIIGLTEADALAAPALGDTLRAAPAEQRANIDFLGYVGRARLYAELSQCLCLVSFSELESFYMVAVEAMAAGCPTITADISSVAESVGDAGILVPSGDVTAAAQAIRSLGNPAIRQARVAAGLAHAATLDAAACADAIVAAVEQAWVARSGRRA